MENKLLKTWRYFCLFIAIVLFVHFLKDITQDILKISTPLDKLGNIIEDLSKIPTWVQLLYFSLWIIGTLLQPFFSILLFRNWNNNHFSTYDKVLLIIIIYLSILFSTAYLLST
jgi:hypothetical protein